MRHSQCDYRSASFSQGPFFALFPSFCTPLVDRRQVVFRQPPIQRGWQHWRLFGVACVGVRLLFGCGGSTTSPTPTPTPTFVDSDHNRDLRNPAGNGSDHFYGQLGPAPGRRDPIRRECEPALPATVIKRRVKPKTTLSGLESEAIVFGLPASVQNVRQPNGIRYS